MVKIFLLAVLVTFVATQYRVFEHISFIPSTENSENPTTEPEMESVPNSTELDYFVSDTIYRWDEYLLDWMVVDGSEVDINKYSDFIKKIENAQGPIEIDWKVLLDIQYKMRYFEELDMEANAPIFSRAVEALKGKEVIIQGFCIPFDEKGEAIVLSQNPFAACFFCGKASPASVMSIYFKNKGVQYNLDDFIKFQGILDLNYDDPKEFYYILNDAVEARKK